MVSVTPKPSLPKEQAAEWKATTTAPKEVVEAIKAGKLHLPSVYREYFKLLLDQGKITEAQHERLWNLLLPSLRMAARVDVNFFCELVMVDDETGMPVKQSKIHKEWAKLAEEHNRLLIWSHIESAKCLPAGEQVLLATGEWRNVEDIKERIRVTLMDPATMTKRQAWALPVVENGVKSVVKITLGSGRVVRVTENHPLFKPTGWAEAGTVKAGDFLAAARELPDGEAKDGMSALDAEMLGYLVGDGGLSIDSRVGFTKKDPAIIERVAEICRAKGWVLAKAHGPYAYRIARENGNGGWHGVESSSVWSERHGIRCLSKYKRVPEILFTSSNESIIAFLGAYFSCDGYVGPKQADFSSASYGLLVDTQRLLYRLGIGSRLDYKKARCNGKVFDAWRLFMYGAAACLFASKVKVYGDKAARLAALKVPDRTISHRDGVPNEWISLHPGWRPLDHDKYKFLRGSRTNHRTKVQKYLKVKPDPVVEQLASNNVFWDQVESVELQLPEMTYSLEVDDPAHCFLQSGGILSHNSTQISVARTVWELGKDPTLRFAILSNTKGQAEQLLRSIALLIERNEEVHAIFPNLKPDPAGPWTNSKLRVIRPGNAKDASVRAVGVHGDLTGARVDRLIVDDILDPENCETEAARKKLSAWYKAVAAGRLTARSRVLVIGTAYHPKDLLHELSVVPRWKWVRFTVLDENGQSTWPERWPLERIENKKAELGPAEFARQMLCKARDDGEARFKQEWINLALAAGDGLKMLDRVDPDALEEGAMIFTGVDLAARRMKRSDSTVLFTFLEDKKGRRRLLDVTSGKLTGPQIIQQIQNLNERYHPVLIAVENNACFPPGTMVRTRDHGYRPIETIKVGELVFTHKGRWRKVVKLFSQLYAGSVVTIKVDGASVVSASEHLFMAQEAVINGGRQRPSNNPDWFAAEELGNSKHGNYVCRINAEASCSYWAKVTNARLGKYEGVVYDLEVEGDNSYVANGFLVHNCQDYILQFMLDQSNIPVVPFTTGRNKRDPVLGVEGLAIELSNAKWVFPNAGGHYCEELGKFIEEMLFYTPNKHCGDRLMASWFAREKARDVMGSRDGNDENEVHVRVIGAAPSTGPDEMDMEAYQEQQKIYSDSSFTVE